MDMMCDECGIRPANVRLTTIVNGEKRDRNLCSECFANSPHFKQNFTTLAGHFNGLLDALKSGISKQAEEPLPDLKCSGCSTTYEQFHKSGVLGCAQCYQSFREPLLTMMSRTQGRTQHVGRTPGSADSRLSAKLKIERLRQALSKAIFEEEYERAAELRDQIHALEACSTEEDDIR